MVYLSASLQRRKWLTRWSIRRWLRILSGDSWVNWFVYRALHLSYTSCHCTHKLLGSTHTHTYGYTINYSGRISPRSAIPLICVSSFSIFCFNEQETSLSTTQNKSVIKCRNIPLAAIKSNRSEHPYNDRRQCGNIIKYNTTLTGDWLMSSKHLSQAQVKLYPLRSLAWRSLCNCSVSVYVMNSCSPGPISLTALRRRWRPLNSWRVLGRQEWLSREGAEYKPTPTRAWSSTEFSENRLQNNYIQREGAWSNTMNNHNVCTFRHSWWMTSGRWLLRWAVPVIISCSTVLSLPVNQSTGTMEGKLRGHLSTASCYVSRGAGCPWSALGGLVLRMVPPFHSHLSHSYTPPCAAANPNAAYNTHWGHTHTHTHVPGSQSRNNKQTCIGCTSLVTYTQSIMSTACNTQCNHSLRAVETASAHR